VVIWFVLQPTGKMKQSEEDTALDARFIDYLRK
jgi:hypothetical protein